MRIVLVLLLVGCAEDLRSDVTPFRELDYKGWKQTQVEGDAPGHAGYRTIYVNDIARDPMQGFYIGYPEGSILIKEVYNDAARTDLRHVAVMRRIGVVEKAYENEGGWYFTEAKGDGPEQSYDFCYPRCHVAAPYNGAWFDYRD